MRWTGSPALAPLREHDFRWYFASRTVNLVGTAMGAVALAFAVIEVSSSPNALGIVLAAHSIPMVVFLLAGGVIADRFGRTLVIQVSNVAAGLSQLAIAALVLAGSTHLWPLVVLTAVNGVVSAVSFPALASVLPQLVPRDQLQAANVLSSMVRNAFTILGPTMAALLVVTAGAGWALAVDGVTYLLAALLLSRIRLPRPIRGEEAPSVVAELREGWTYFRSTTWLWVVVLAFSLLNAAHQGGWYTLGPLLASRTSMGAQGWGLVLSAEAVGLLVTTVVLLRVRLQRPLFWGMWGTALYGLPLVAMGLHPQVLLVMAAALVAGAGIEVFGLGWNLALQEHVPDRMLSRAFSYDAFGSFVAIPIGQLAAGPLATALGLQRVVLGAGIAVVVIALLTLSSRSVRTLPRASQEPEPVKA